MAEKSNSFVLNGHIQEIHETKQVTDSFRKREFVIETIGEYPQFIKFEVVQGNCEKLHDKKIGDNVDVSFNVKGRKFERDGQVKYFTGLEAWKVWVNRDGESEEELPF